MEYREQVVVFRKGGYKPYRPYHHVCGHQKMEKPQTHITAYQRFRYVT